MVINVHAGHCPDGKGACGAIGIIKESTENRNVKNKLIEYLRTMGHTVYDCTVDTQETKSDCLKKIVAMCNTHAAAIDISIHFNDADNHDYKGDGRQIGTEVWATNYNGIKGTIANDYLDGMKKLGFKIHGEGKHTSSGLYVLKNTKAPALLFEVCFVGDADDVNLYKKVGPAGVARVLAEAITGEKITDDVKGVCEIKSGDTVKVTAENIKIYDRGDSKAVTIGTLYKDVEKKVVALNEKKTRIKLASGFWISTKNVKKV